MTVSKNEELFDVVDEQNQLIGVRPRSEVHRLNLRHRAAHIFLFRSDGSMLIHLRTATKEEFPSVWTSSASGHVSSGEGYAESAERELQEELGISARLTFVAKFDAYPETSNEFTELFVAHSDDSLEVDPNEIADIAWLHPDQIASKLEVEPNTFSPAFRVLFCRYRELGMPGS